jgi:hypothetical protein
MTAVTTALHVRVSVPEVWDTVHLTVAPDSTVASLMAEALKVATGRDPDAGRFEVKFRGAKVIDETMTLAQLDVPDNAALIVLKARRQPVT